MATGKEKKREKRRLDEMQRDNVRNARKKGEQTMRCEAVYNNRGVSKSG